MKSTDIGVEDGSEVYFHTPSSLEKLMFLYPLCTGHFFCNPHYETTRKNFDNYLIMYIKKGSGMLWYEEKQIPLKTGDFILIDCNKPHTYKAEVSWETVWMHFNGFGADRYYHVITEKAGNVLHIGEGLIYQLLYRIFKSYRQKEGINVAVMSSYIHRILSHMYEDAVGVKRENGALYDVLQYIESNYGQELSLERLCAQVHLSPYYFSRIFKKQMGYSPYEYIIVVRLNAAKRLLKNTKKTVKEIAFETGFNSEANFIRTFKTYTDMTPGRFRKIEL